MMANTSPDRPSRSAPPDHALSRRSVLAATALLALPAAAEPAPTGLAPTGAALDDAGFLRLSEAATGHAGLDATVAARTFAALSAADAAFAGQAASLAALGQPGGGPEALLAAADTAGLKAPLLALVAAWYTGTVGDGPDATVVAYADALMFRPTADAAPVPTYCGRGPLWWTAAPPALGIPVQGEG